MVQSSLFDEFNRLRRFVRWSPDDAARVRAIAPVIESHLDSLVEQFYADLLAEPVTAKILSDADRVKRLKISLAQWVLQLLSMEMSEQYVASRWRVGRRHVELAIPQLFVIASMGRLRARMIDCVLRESNRADSDLAETDITAALESLNKLFDLDQAIIEHAYGLAYSARQRQVVRDRYESVLHREREFSEGLLELAHAIVLMLDHDGRIVRFNPYFTKLSGYDLEDVVGCDWFELFLAEEDRGTARELFAEMLSAGSESHAVNPIVTRTGERRQISWSNRVLTDTHRKIIGVLAIGQDITELHASQAKALQAERLAAIGRMSTGLAHESRNALQRIQANCEVLELELADHATALQYISRIQKAGDHLRLLLDEVRSYAAEINLDLSTTTISSAWREAWRLLEGSWAGREVIFTENCEGVDVKLTADHFRLVQIFRNILENAIAARRDDPLEIQIGCERVARDGKQMLRVSVRDNGCGMNAEQQQRIFEPFFTTKSTGTGLGMALAHRYIEAHGGSITIGETSPAGTELVLYFPCDREAAQPSSKESAAWTA